MFQAFARRVAAERVLTLKNAMITGAWANSNYDDEDYREKLLTQIDSFANSAMMSIYNIDETPVIDESDPFWKAARVPQIDPRPDFEKVEELDAG